MPSSPSRNPDRDPLQKLLHDAESELRRRLEDACEAEAKGVATESTEQIRRLEDNLLAAALAAKQTIAVRSQMKGRKDAQRERPMAIDAAADLGARQNGPRKTRPEPGAAEASEPEVVGVREFTDDSGRSWRAWSVVPGLSRSSASGGRFLGDFQEGWICFEGVDAAARRRLPYPRAKWLTVSDEELRQLLREAIDAPIRQKKA
jgi:hypothetical protein